MDPFLSMILVVKLATKSQHSDASRQADVWPPALLVMRFMRSILTNKHPTGCICDPCTEKSGGPCRR